MLNQKTLIKRFILLLAGFLPLFFYLIIYADFFGPRPLVLGKERITIEKGEGANEIALKLKSAKLINSPFVFNIYVFLKGDFKKLKAGSYIFSFSENLPEIAVKLAKGGIEKRKVTIVEGWNLKNIAAYLEINGIAKAEDFYRLAGEPFFLADLPVDYNCQDIPEELKSVDFSEEFPFLSDKPKNTGLEGYLFPDTYEVFSSETGESLIRKMLKNFGSKLTPEILAEVKFQEKTVFETVTMASLLEKEVREIKDKKIVAGILYKRLKAGMFLQVDASLVYSVNQAGRKLPLIDSGVCSPYNTYRFKGLPVSPIGNPGKDSLLAAVYPEPSDYWYYLSDNNGQTIFSKTLKEHNLNKAKYLK